MVGNSFGELFRITTFGESHGKAIGVVIDGFPAGIQICEKDIEKELERRKPKDDIISTTRKEEDKVEILSGVFEGKTTGMPIAVMVWNKDIKTADYEKIKNIFRPGHADYSYFVKYGIRDYRGGGRSSGRETVTRVIAYALAKKILERFDVKIYSYTKEVFGIKAQEIDLDEIEKNPLRLPDKKAYALAKNKIEEIAKEKDSVGGIVEIIVKNCPVGLGEPVFSKLDAELAKALVSIGGVKGVEFGVGFSCAKMKGSEMNDKMKIEKNKPKFLTNNSGGIIGGISNGEEIVIRIAVKPTPSIGKKQQTINEKMEEVELEIEGRHDKCLCPRVSVVAEAMVGVVLADFILRNNIKNF